MRNDSEMAPEILEAYKNKYHKHCPCGIDFVSTRSNQIYHNSACKAKFWRLRKEYAEHTEAGLAKVSNSIDNT